MRDASGDAAFLAERRRLHGLSPDGMTYLPGVTWTTTTPSSPVASLDSINSVASTPADTQAQVCGENAPLRILYGRPRVGAQVPDMLSYNGNLVMFLVWGEGEINQIESITVGDLAPDPSITLTHYTGTTGQAADATLIAAYASHGVTYADALPGIAYSVAVIPPGTTSGFPTFAAIIQGKKLYDPRLDSTAGGSGPQRENDSSTWTYSDNPALATADFATSTLYGMGKTVYASDLIAAANFDDEMIGGEKRRIIGLALDTPQPCSQWLEALRTYAGCFAPPEGASLRLIPDKPGSSTGSLTVSNFLAGSFKPKLKGMQQVPTVVEIRYTDTSIIPWSQKSAFAKMPGVDAGTTPRRESQVQLPGVARYSQAYREAVERLNKLTLCDLSADFTAFDEALSIQVGDIKDITHPIGLSAKLMRIMGIRIADAGRWQISALEYDPACYIDTVAVAPTYADTTMPDPASPPAVTGLTVAEEVYQLQDGTYSSRIRAKWTAAGFPYLLHYRAEVWSNAALIYTVPVQGTTFPSPPIQEGQIYTVKVQVISDVGAAGDWDTEVITAQGKQLPPGNVPSLTGYEIGGRVYLSWPPATDIDIWKYELRYGLTSGAWETATLIDRFDGLRYQATGIPSGTFRFYVKALDSVLKYSVTAAYCDVVVTLDTNSFLVDTFVASSPTTTNMTAYSVPTDPNTYYVTDFGDGIGYGADNPDDAVGTFEDSLEFVAIASPHTPGTSSWVSDVFDAGQSLTGNWTATASYTDLVGTAVALIELSDDNVVYVKAAGLSEFGTARYARIRLETTGVMTVTLAGNTIKLNVIAKSETITVVTSASALVTVTLAGQYTKVKTIQLTPMGLGDKNAVPDNVIVGIGTFDYVEADCWDADYCEAPLIVNQFDVGSFTGGVRSSDTVQCFFQGI